MNTPSIDFFKLSKPEKPKILVIEDDKFIAENLSELLTLEGFETETALESGKDALHYLNFNLPDLIIMDIQLRGKEDGIQLAKKINSRLEIPIVYLTAFPYTIYLDRVAETKFNGFIVKPYHRETLISTIKLALKKKPLKDLLSPKEGHLTLRKNGFSTVLVDSDIKYVKADKMYTIVVGKTEEYRMRNILKEVAPMLNPLKFIRVHKSYLVNIDYVTSFNHKGIMVDGLVLPMKRSFTKELSKIILHHKSRSN